MKPIISVRCYDKETIRIKRICKKLYRGKSISDYVREALKNNIENDEMIVKNREELKNGQK